MGFWHSSQIGIQWNYPSSWVYESTFELRSYLLFTLLDYRSQRLLVLFNFLGAYERDISSLTLKDDCWHAVHAIAGLFTDQILDIDEAIVLVLDERLCLILGNSCIRSGFQ